MLNKVKKIYMIGVGGISMSALAVILHHQGKKILASDIVLNKQIKALIDKNIITFQKGTCANFVRQCDAVIYTSAIDENNRDLILAKKLNKMIFSRAEILGVLSQNQRTISVAGSHGKTTATGMIANLLINSSLDPTIHIGGILKNISSNVWLGGSDILVSEACEYKDSFLKLSNYISIVLNIKPDHLDYFKNIDNVFNSFQKFVDNTTDGGVIIINNDDDLASKLSCKHKTLSFATNNKAELMATSIKEYESGKYSFDVVFKGKNLGQIYLPCYGRHNIYNALSAIGVGEILGLNFEQIKKGVESFQGIERRFEIIRQNKFITIIHDYAHHPDEIRSTLKLCRTLATDKLVAIFQPHTYSRTRDLYQQFLQSFEDADEVWLLPIYPAREKPIKDISSYKLQKDLKAHGKASKYFSTFQSARQEIIKNAHNSTTFIILGAGDIVDLAYSFYN